MAVADLRVGINVVELEAACDDLDEASRRLVGDVISQISEHYRRASPPDDALWSAIGGAMDALRTKSSASSDMALLHLDGIRRALVDGYRSPLPDAGKALA
jgi:hypothetical protein